MRRARRRTKALQVSSQSIVRCCRSLRKFSIQDSLCFFSVVHVNGERMPDRQLDDVIEYVTVLLRLPEKIENYNNSVNVFSRMRVQDDEGFARQQFISPAFS